MYTKRALHTRNTCRYTMEKRKADQIGEGTLVFDTASEYCSFSLGTVSAFAFKARQAPLQDLSNRSPTDYPTKQPPNRHDGIGGNCKARVPLPSAPHARPPKRWKGANGLPVSVRTTGARQISKHIITSAHTPGQAPSAKISDTSEGLRDEELTSDSNRAKQTDTSDGFGSSYPSADSPKLPSETRWSAFKPTTKNVTERADSLLFQMQEGDVSCNGFRSLL